MVFAWFSPFAVVPFSLAAVFVFAKPNVLRLKSLKSRNPKACLISHRTFLLKPSIEALVSLWLQCPRIPFSFRNCVGVCPRDRMFRMTTFLSAFRLFIFKLENLLERRHGK